MLGAICGDIIGSRFEMTNIKTKNFELFDQVYHNCYTDDSVLTCAIAYASYNYRIYNDLNKFKYDCIKYMQILGRRHINVGYGSKFKKWLYSTNPKPYNSYGNGSAMRVSSVSFVSKTLEEAEMLAEISAAVTHNHPEGIRGAQAVAGIIWLLLNGASKEEIKNYVENKFYYLNFTLESIRENYKFDGSCQGTVPQAIVAFLEGSDFEDVIRNAISIGGDSDTIAAIAGSMAEAYYGIPDEIKEKTLLYLDIDLYSIIEKFYDVDLKNAKKL